MIVLTLITILFVMVITIGAVMFFYNAVKYEYKYPFLSLIAYLIWPISIIIVFIYLALKNLKRKS